MKTVIALLFLAVPLMAQNPPADPRTTTTDPTGAVCAPNSVLNYIPSGALFTCQNGVYARAGSSGTVTSIQVSGTSGQITATACGPSTTTLNCVLSLATGAVNPQTSTYQVLASDFSGFKTITVASGTFTITLVASGSQPANGSFINVVNYGAGIVTVSRSGQNINGTTSSLTLPAASATAPTAAQIWSDGANYFAKLSGSSSSSSIIIANSSSTGTTVNTLTKLTGAPSTAVIAAVSDTGNAIGITTAGAGTTGNATVQLTGSASCVFDANGVTAGDYVQISSLTAGNCADAGASFPAFGQVVGRALATQAGAGTVSVILFGNGG